MEKISRLKALSLNRKWFLTGRPCHRGHIAPRYVSSGTCMACGRTKYNLDNGWIDNWFKNYKIEKDVT